MIVSNLIRLGQPVKLIKKINQTDVILISVVMSLHQITIIVVRMQKRKGRPKPKKSKERRTQDLECDKT